MSIGKQVKQGFLMVFKQVGGAIQIHKNWGTPEQSTVETSGLKNNEKGRPSKVMFQFPERIDISAGDVVQQKGGGDLWRVIETEDCIQAGEYIYFEAKVEKLNGAPRQSRSPTNVVIHGPNYGGVQISSPNATQNVSVEFHAVSENVAKLRGLAKKLNLAELDSEDLEEAFARLAQLSQKQKSPDLLLKVKEKIGYIESIFGSSVSIATEAVPYLAAITQAFGMVGS